MSLFKRFQEVILKLTYKRAPRSARRVRKPLQDNWPKRGVKGTWIKCTYERCAFRWKYFGGRKWAECPICHSVMKVAVSKRNHIYN